MSQLDDNVGNFLKQTLVSYHVFFGKPRDILPCVVWKVTRRIMKTVFGIRSFKKTLTRPSGRTSECTTSVPSFNVRYRYIIASHPEVLLLFRCWRKAEVHHVSVLYDVFLALHAKLSGGLAARLAP